MLRKLTTLIVLTVTVVGCRTQDSRTTERETDIYVAVIEALVADAVTSPDILDDGLVVYAVSLDEDHNIALEVQASVAEELEEVVTVRFVDERAEAIDDTEDDEPVLEDGVLVALGTVPPGTRPSVGAELYLDRTRVDRVQVNLERARGEWAVANLG